MKKEGLADRLGAVLGRFWVVLGAVLEGKNRLKPFVLNGFVKNHVFDVDQLSRRVLDPSWPILAAKSAKNDPNLAPQDDPKSSKNTVQNMIKILIDFKTAIPRLLGPTGGMRSPQGGTLGRSKNSAKEDLQ